MRARYVGHMSRMTRFCITVVLFGSITVVGTSVSVPVGAASTHARSPLLCGAVAMAKSGPDLWVSGCVFKTHSAFSTRIPAVIEVDSTNGAVLRVIKDHETGNDGPAGIAVADGRVWVANGDGNTVLELNAHTGSIVRMIKPKSEGLNSPWVIAASGSRVWVYNTNGNAISELNASNGSLVRNIMSKDHDLAWVATILPAGSKLWLTDPTNGNDAVIALNRSDGTPVKVINAQSDDFNGPDALAIRKNRIWIASDSGPLATTPQADADPYLPGGSVTELDAATDAVVRVIDAKADQFYGSGGIAVGRTHVWVTNSTGGSVTELNAASGSLVRVIRAKRDDFGDPSDVVIDGSHVWILDSAHQENASGVWGGAITELNTSDGSLVRVIK